MKPFIVLLLVALAAGSLFVVLNKDDPGTTPPESGGSDLRLVDPPVEEKAPVEAANLTNVDGGDDRETVDPTVAGVVEADGPSTSASLAGYGAVTGLVTDEQGSPVEAATVTLTQFGSQPFDIFGDFDRSKDVQASTDNEGRYTFRRVPVQDGFSIIVTHPDFSRTELPGVSAQDGEMTELTIIRLGKGRAVRGRISDTSGSFVPGARVILALDAFRMGLEEGEGSIDQLETVSDNQGNYEFPNVAPGPSYMMTIIAEGYGRANEPALAVLESEDTVKDVVLEVASLLAGQVMSSDGEPIEGVSVEAWSNEATKRKVHTKTMSLEDGSFEFTDVPPGNYTLVARHKLHAANARERAEAGDVNVTITMEPLPTISGQLLDAGSGAPIPKGIVQLRAQIVGSQNGQTQGLNDTRIQIDDPEGRFTLVSPKAGSYIVEGKAAGYADTYSELFETALGENTSGITVRMTRGGIITGRVVDDSGQPVAGATVESHDEVWSDDAFMRVLGDIGDASEKVARTRADGTFELKGLTPAKYQILVRHKEYAQEKVTGLVVTEGQTTTSRDAVLPRGATISGVVYGPGGSTMAGAQVRLFPTTTDGRAHNVTTGADGSFSMRSVREGTYKIHATRRRSANDSPFAGNVDLKDTQREITVRNGQELGGQEFRLKEH